MTVDYYAETGQIIEALTSEGLSSEADALREAMAKGSTATEILMAIRWHLQQIDRANKSANLTTKRRVRALVKELDKVLS
jgi:hypothetical protein